MNHCVPDFEIDENYSIPSSSSGFTRTNKSVMGEEEIMELLWQNGQVVVQSQTQKSGRKSHGGSEVVIPSAAEKSATREFRSAAAEAAERHLFMQEDEMASWLNYPLEETSFDRDIYSDLFYPLPMSTSREIEKITPEIRPQPQPPPPPPPVAVAPSPYVPPTRREQVEGSPREQNFSHFGHFSRLSKAAGMRSESGPSKSSKEGKESTVVESNETPAVGPTSRVSTSHAARSRAPYLERGTMSGNGVAGTSATGGELTTTCELTVTSSSPGGSGASVSPNVEPSPPPQQHQEAQKQPPPETAADRKRKRREADDSEGYSEEIEFETGEVRNQARGSTSSKRSRAAEVHNLSERRRRDRINEKMKALQELIPHCNKSDKASMLDEAIEYLKSLQLQVQMMSMGCSMVPVMYPGFQQYMPAMGGMGMGMSMRMNIGMNRPMVPYPPLLPGSTMPNPAAAAHVVSRFPVPAFHVPPVPVPEPSGIQASNASDPRRNSLVPPTLDQPRHSYFVDPYQHYPGLHPGQMLLPQNQAVVQPSAEKPSSSIDIGNPENQQPGG